MGKEPCIMVILRGNEKELIKAAAEREKRNLSNYCRVVLLEAARKQ